MVETPQFHSDFSKMLIAIAAWLAIIQLWIPIAQGRIDDVPSRIDPGDILHFVYCRRQLFGRIPLKPKPTNVRYYIDNLETGERKRVYPATMPKNLNSLNTHPREMCWHVGILPKDLEGMTRTRVLMVIGGPRMHWRIEKTGMIDIQPPVPSSEPDTYWERRLREKYGIDPGQFGAQSNHYYPSPPRKVLMDPLPHPYESEIKPADD